MRDLARLFVVTALLFLALPTLKSVASESSGIADRQALVLAQYNDAALVERGAKAGPYQVLALTAANGCLNRGLPAYMSEILLGGEVDDGKSLPFHIFSLPPLVRYLYQYGDCMSAAEKGRVKQLLSREFDLAAHGTLNHAILQASSLYLLAQYFPDLQWQDKQGGTFTSDQVMERLAQLMNSRTRNFFAAGYYEQSSPTYVMANFFPLLNLVDFAQDEDVRSGAEAEATLQLALLKTISFQGRLVPPLTRAIKPQRVREPSEKPAFAPAVAQHILWYYFGEPALGPIDLQDEREPYFLIMLALSDWMPPSAILDMASSATPPYEVETVIPSFSIWGAPTRPEIIGSAYFGEGFAIGTGNHIFDPAGYNEANNLFGILFETNGDQGLVDCYHPYWLSNLGPNAWSFDRSSPFQQVHREGSRGVLLFDIPRTDPYKYGPENRFFAKRNERANQLIQSIQCRFPSDIDEAVLEKDAVFLREGNTFIALRTLVGSFTTTPVQPGEMAGFEALSVNAPNTAIYFKVERGNSAADFADFVSTTSHDQLTFDGKTASFPAELDGRISVTYQRDALADGWVRSIPLVLVDGKPKEDQRASSIVAPFLHMQSGRVQINGSINSHYELAW